MQQGGPANQIIYSIGGACDVNEFPIMYWSCLTVFLLIAQGHSYTQMPYIVLGDGN